MKSIEFYELAEKELINCRDYYDDLVFGLGGKFITEVEHIINKIKINSEAFPIYYKNFRRALLRKFPYSIIYVEENEKIYIFAVAHQKRIPNYFAHRMN